MKLGVLGGTFNPIHLAHLRLAEEMREALALARVLLIPAGDPPLKHSGVAPAEHRLEMVRRAAAANPAFEVLDLERRIRGGRAPGHLDPVHRRGDAAVLQRRLTGGDQQHAFELE